MASWKGVTWSLYWPIAEYAVNAGSVTWGKTLAATGNGMFSEGLLKPNLSAKSRRVGPLTFSPIAPNAVLHDSVNAKISVGWPSPQVSPPSLISGLEEPGSARLVGASTRDCGLATLPVLSAAELVMTLNEEPGGNVTWVARFSSGWAGSCRYAASILLSRVPDR